MSMGNFLVGRRLEECREMIKNLGFSYRIVNADGIPFMITADFDSNRLNLTVEDNVIMKVVLG